MVIDRKSEVRESALADLERFIRLVHPHSLLGSIHQEVIQWWCREDAKSHQILLLPRDHRKSYLIACRAAWEITRNPAVTILYISSTSNLATKQLKLIKDILTSDTYRFYWPEMVHPDEGKREKWTETEMSVDHPLRKQEVIRDPTVFTAGLTTSIVGLHCNIAILDDVVTAQNALTAEGREKTEQQYSLLASIETTGAKEWIVGTRYHPEDLYGTLLSKKIQTFDELGRLVAEEDLYEEFTRQVETIGDGTGEYLWPRQQRKDGKWFGFNQQILDTKKAQYLDQVQFRAQYYNDPTGGDTKGIPKENFQYYNRDYLHKYKDQWYLKGDKLNVFAAIDFAYTTKDRSDYTAIVVVGVDRNLNYYILDIDRFKTDQISVYFDHLLQLHQKWNFYKLRAEATAAQSVIIKALKTDYIRRLNVAISIDEHKPYVDKQVRTYSILEPKYANKQMWHYLGGLCQTLEEELSNYNSPHDDIKDALAASLSGAIAPVARYNPNINYSDHTHPRYGGIA